MNEHSDLLTVPEFALALRIQPSCVRRWIGDRKIETVRIGRLVRIPSTEVNRIIREGNPSGITISAPGSTGQTTLTVSGFSSNSISFSCSGLPSEATCSFGTSSFSGGGGTVTLQIATTAPSMSSLDLPLNSNPLGQTHLLVFPGLIAIMIFLTRQGCCRRLVKMVAAIPMVLVMVLGLLAVVVAEARVTRIPEHHRGAAPLLSPRPLGVSLPHYR